MRILRCPSAHDSEATTGPPPPPTAITQAAALCAVLSSRAPVPTGRRGPGRMWQCCDFKVCAAVTAEKPHCRRPRRPRLLRVCATPLLGMAWHGFAWPGVVGLATLSEPEALGAFGDRAQQLLPQPLVRVVLGQIKLVEAARDGVLRGYVGRQAKRSARQRTLAAR